MTGVEEFCLPDRARRPFLPYPVVLRATAPLLRRKKHIEAYRGSFPHTPLELNSGCAGRYYSAGGGLCRVVLLGSDLSHSC